VISPIGLWALLALTIPILIHLFNRSRGRLVRIGNIDLVRKARKLRVTEIRLSQLLLLLLRLGIFTLAALILAGLARPGLESSASPTIYVTPAWLKTSEPAAIDDLLSNNESSRIFLLHTGFEVLDKATVDAIRKIPLDASNIENSWPLLAERLSLEIHGGSVDVYATDFLAEFDGKRPGLPRNVDWHITHPESGPAPGNQSITAVIAFDHERSSEAETFRAVLASLKIHRLPGLTWEMVDADGIAAQQLNADWLIHLSDDDLNTDQLNQIRSETTVLTDAANGLQSIGLQYITLPFYPYSTFRLEGLQQNSDHAGTILTAANGWPALQEYRIGEVRILKFNSRFKQKWSSIAQQAEFPELFLYLMLGRNQQILAFADARINPALLKRNDNPRSATPLPRRSIQSFLAILLILLWVAERWLSERKFNENG